MCGKWYVCSSFFPYSRNLTSESEPNELLPMKSTGYSDNQEDFNIKCEIPETEKSCTEIESVAVNEEQVVIIGDDAGSKAARNCHRSSSSCCCNTWRCCKAFRRSKLAVLLRYLAMTKAMGEFKIKGNIVTDSGF